MLEKMRESSQGITAKIILGVLILSFALAGVSGYLGSTSPNAVVSVNGDDISAQQVEQAYQNERARLQQQYGEQFDLIASSPNFVQQVRAQATQTLINELVISQTVESMGLRVGDEQIKNAIRDMPDFQIDGQFNNDVYLSLLRNNNLSPSQFSANFKADLERMQLLQSLVNSEFILPFEDKMSQKLQGQQRVARILNIKSNAFDNTEPVSDAEIETFYTENTQFFQEPEKVKLDYILLDANDIDSDVVVTEDEIQLYYEQNEADFQRIARRKVAHILIEGDSDEAKDKAQAILLELEAGADFSELAETKSDDQYSAKNKGELDWFERGVMDPAFDESAFNLSVASPLSGVVKSEFGFHIIKLIEAQDNETRPLSDVEVQISKKLTSDKARELYDDLYQRLSEVAFESPDSLEEASDEVSIAVQTSELFSSANAPTFLNDQAIINQVFNEDFQDEGLNSDIIELGDMRSVVVRINEHQVASIKPLAAVSESIKQQLTEQKAANAAKNFVELLLTKLKSGESVSKQLAEKGIAFEAEATIARYGSDLETHIVERLFQLAKPSSGEVTRDYVVTAQGDFAVIELSEIIELANSEYQDLNESNIMPYLEQGAAEATYQSLLADLLSNSEVVYKTNN